MRKLIAWLRPFRVGRATYDTHLRVKFFWWLRWAYGGFVAACAGWLLSVGAAGWAMLGREYGVSHITSADVVGWYAARLCLATGNCDEAGFVLGGAVVSVGIAAWGLGFLVWFLLPGYPPKPDRVTDAELDEFRQMGYIVMEEEDFKDVIREHVDGALVSIGYPGGDSQPGELDKVGGLAAWVRTCREILEQSASADQRRA